MIKVPKHITVAPGWHQGGTLLEATIGEWHQASWRNALATCSLWIRAAAQLHNQPTYDDAGELIGYHVTTIDFVSKGDLLDYSVALLRALADGTGRRLDDPAVRKVPIGPIVQTTLQQLGWQGLKDPSVSRAHFELLKNSPQEAPEA